MLNLFELLQKAQGGQPAEAMARQFGLSPGQAQSAIDALLPAFTLAFQNIMKDPQTWPAMMAMMSGGGNPFIPAGLQPDAVKAFFGPGDLSERIAAQAAAVSGLSTQVMQQIMPVMASALAGGFLRDMAQGGFGAMFGQGAGTTGTSIPGIPDNWGELWGQWMKAGVPGEDKPEKAAATGGDSAPNPFDPAYYADMMQRMMNAATGTPEAPAAPETPPPPPPTASDLGLDAMSQIVEAGREVQEQHMQALQELFARMGENARK